MRALLFILPSQKMPRPFSEKTLEVFARKYAGFSIEKCEGIAGKIERFFSENKIRINQNIPTKSFSSDRTWLTHTKPDTISLQMCVY